MRSFWSRIFSPRGAATWFARTLSGEMNARTDRLWRQWLGRDGKNESSYARVTESWEAAAHIEGRPAARIWLQEVDRLIEARTLMPQRPVRRGWILATAGLGGLALISALVVLGYRDAGAVAGSYRTEIGEQRSIVLPDQSKADLNTATQIDTRFSRRAREVQLRAGEALFDVRKDPSRPFVVRAAGGAVTAVGTRFSVQLASENQVDVSVLEGTVMISHPMAGGRTIQLSAGQHLAYTDSGTFSAIGPADALRIEGWRRGRLVFQDEPLADTLREFNRYTRTPVVLESAELATRRFGGVFRTGETQSFLDALKASLDVDVVQEQGRITIRAKVAPKPR